MIVAQAYPVLAASAELSRRLLESDSLVFLLQLDASLEGRRA